MSLSPGEEKPASIRLMRFAWAILLMVLFSVPAFAGKFAGQVVGVIDGNTIDVLRNQRSERIRLHGIDCPEKKQAYRQQATWPLNAYTRD